MGKATYMSYVEPLSVQAKLLPSLAFVIVFVEVFVNTSHASIILAQVKQR